MNLMLQIMGLVFNIYIIFLLIVSNTYSFNNIYKFVLTSKEKLYSITQDNNKMKSINRIVQLLMILYILFNLQFIFAIDTCELNGSIIELSIMDGIYKINKTKLIIELFIFLIAYLIIIAQNYYYYNQTNSTFSEIYLILLTNILGISTLLYSNDWLVTIISWELFNLSLYLLVSLNSFSESSLSASLKYFLLSALSTAFLLLGIAIIYYIIGSTNYDNIYISISQLIQLSNTNTLMSVNFAFFLIVVTFLFKLSAAPLHNWAPDLYDGLHTNISIWMIIIPKITVLSLLFFLSKDLLLLSNYESFIFSPISFLSSYSFDLL
jgi:NADH-ubiquinone oxidoreductase chain 2